MITTEQNTEASAPGPQPDEFVIRSFEDALEWIRRQNPNIATNRPQDLDWQAIKREGRRY